MQKGCLRPPRLDNLTKPRSSWHILEYGVQVRIDVIECFGSEVHTLSINLYVVDNWKDVDPQTGAQAGAGVGSLGGLEVHLTYWSILKPASSLITPPPLHHPLIIVVAILP